MRKIISALVGLLLGALVIPAHGQTMICFKSSAGSGCTPVATAAPLPVTVISGSGEAVTLASGAVASGAYSSGAYAAGALAAGAFAVGAGVDGWDLTQGARADAAWTTGSGSVISLLKTIAGAEIAANRSVNIAQINGVTPLMGNGVTGTGSPRVTIASDNTAFTVNAAQLGTWAVQPGGFLFSHIATATTTTVKSGAGSVHTVCVNSLGTVASSITVYDNTAGSGTVIAIINSLALLGCQTYDVAFATGLTLVTTGTAAPDVTVSYR